MKDSSDQNVGKNIIEPIITPEHNADSVPMDTEQKTAQPTARDLLKDDISAIKVRRAKRSKNIIFGICVILATYNNTKIVFLSMSL